MKEENLFLQHRRVKQLLMSIAFIFVLIGGWFYPLMGFFIPTCMLAGIGIALFQGRKWCDWYCPRGSFLDNIVARISPQKRIPWQLKSLPVRIGVIVFLMTLMAIQIVRRWPDPYRIGAFFVAMLTVTTLLGVIAAFFFHQRLWCYVCPIGTMSNVVGKDKHMLEIDSESCVECRLCSKVCPMQIKPYTYKKEGKQVVKDYDCLKCSSCVALCPKHALSFGDAPKRDRSKLLKIQRQML